MIRFALALASLSLAALATPALADDATDGAETPACPAVVPAAVVPAADQRLRFSRVGDGDQIYVCTANAAGAFSWLFVTPRANLYKGDKLVGTHFFGPIWQGNDDSSVKAAKVAAATVDPTAIAWLLLTSVGNTGPGHFADITSVQRLNTVGGN
ncbi:MAG TPA: DUF3455 domain-containing protein, partial [Myxococcota bacterium]